MPRLRIRLSSVSPAGGLTRLLFTFRFPLAVVSPTALRDVDVGTLLRRLFLMAMEKHHLVAVDAEDHPRLDPAGANGGPNLPETLVPDRTRDRHSDWPPKFDRRDVLADDRSVLLVQSKDPVPHRPVTRLGLVEAGRDPLARAARHDEPCTS